MRRWELQEPVGESGAPAEVGSAALAGGFEDAYFFTDPRDGAMTFWVPEDGVTTAHSRFPRAELRELAADGSEANWSPVGAHALSAVVAVVRLRDRVCVGQIHVGSPIRPGLAPSTKPLLELYQQADGEVVVGIERDPVSGGQRDEMLTRVALGTIYRYVVRLIADETGEGTLAVAIDGIERTFPMPASFVGYGEYFKAGDYIQRAGNEPTVGAAVKFYALQVAHSP